MDPESLVSLVRLGLVTVCLWVASRAFELVRSSWQTHQKKKSYIRALFAEIDFNLVDLKRFVAVAPNAERLTQSLSDNKTIPHLTDARHTDIYKSNLDLLYHLDDDLISSIVGFYGTLEKMNAMITGVLQPSYLTISTQGRVNVVLRLQTFAAETSLAGDSILEKLDTGFPNLNLQKSRKSKAGPATPLSFDDRRSALEQDLREFKARFRRDRA
ncbi:MAG: hypothetical protein OXR62_16980 [Ahrensia sp.]|nr:hypothetical protein [Ahrensia sp.]